MLQTKERSRKLREALKAHLFPALRERGFNAQKHSSLFYNFIYTDEKHVIGISVQWDKYHRPRFVVNFAFAPLQNAEDGRAGFVPPYGEQSGQWLPAEQITKCFGVYSGRLHAGMGYERWFRCSFLRYIINKEACANVALNCTALLPLLENWIKTADAERLSQAWFKDHISYFAPMACAAITLGAGNSYAVM